MAFSYVSTTVHYPGAGPSTELQVTGYNVGSNNLLVLLTRWEAGDAADAATCSFADSETNTYTNIAYKNSTDDTRDTKTGLFYCAPATGNASMTITGTISAAREYCELAIIQYSYAGDISVGTPVTNFQLSTTTWTAGTAITASSGDLLVAGIGVFTLDAVITAAQGNIREKTLCGLNDYVPASSGDVTMNGSVTAAGETANTIAVKFTEGSSSPSVSYDYRLVIS